MERNLLLKAVILMFVGFNMTATGVKPLTKNKLLPKVSKTIDYNCQSNICISKCCRKDQIVFGQKKKCVNPKKFKVPDVKDIFKEVSLYLPSSVSYFDNLTPSERFFNFTVVPAWLFDKKNNESSFDTGFSLIPPNYYLTEEGILYTEQPNTFNRWAKHDKGQFCMDYIVPMPSLNIHNFTVRFINIIPNTEENVDKSPLIGVGLLISVIFLFLVLVVYTLLPDLRNLNGKVLMAYVFSLMCGFILLYLIRCYPTLSAPVCKIMTYCTYFLLLASFCWTNVMSCDIWWTFRGYAKARSIHRRGENFKFGMYCIYALCLPAALTVMLIVMNEIDLRHVPWIITPNIFYKSRFIGNQEKFYYMYMPMLILISCNWIFFLMTAFNIWRLHRATAVLDSAAAGSPAAHRSHKYRFLVYLKLSIIMGINWIMEVAGSFYPDFIGWYIADIYNALTGLSIFLVLVCKMKIIRKLAKRFSRRSDWTITHKWSRSRQSSTTTTESEVSADVPVCINPRGPNFFDKR